MKISDFDPSEKFVHRHLIYFTVLDVYGFVENVNMLSIITVRGMVDFHTMRNHTRLFARIIRRYHEDR